MKKSMIAIYLFLGLLALALLFVSFWVTIFTTSNSKSLFW